MKSFIIKYKKQFIITTSVLVLDCAFGFDVKFTVINMVWLFM